MCLVPVPASVLTVSYLQVMGSSSSSYQIPWPGFMRSLLDQMRVALLDVYAVMAVDCFADYSFYEPFWITTVTTSATLLLAFVAHLCLPRVIAT